MNAFAERRLIQWIISIPDKMQSYIMALSDIDKLNMVPPGQLFRWWILG